MNITDIPIWEDPEYEFYDNWTTSPTSFPEVWTESPVYSTSDCATVTPYWIVISILGTSLLVSELLPFFKGSSGNGIADILIMCLRASHCMINTCLELESSKAARAEARNDIHININTKDSVHELIKKP